MPETKITTNEINQTIDTQIVGNTIIKSDIQLTGSVDDGFPNTTNLYIWNMDGSVSATQTDIIGSKALTIGAGALTAGADVLGNSKYCAFDGSTYLTSNDAAFSFNGNFSISFWIYGDYTPAAASIIISNRDASNGWDLQLTGADGNFQFYNKTANIAEAVVNVLGLLDNTWHHFVLTRALNDRVTIVVDGAVLATGTANAFTATNEFNIASFHNGSNKFTGRIDEVVVYNGTVLTTDQARNIYARSAKKFAVKDANLTVKIENQTPVAIYKTYPTEGSLSQATETSIVNFIIPESGLYLISGNLLARGQDVGGEVLMRIKAGSSTVGSAVLLANSAYMITIVNYPVSLANTIIKYLVAGDILHLAASINSPTARYVFGDAGWGLGVTSLSAVKIG